MPNSPITAIRKSKPRISSACPKVSRNWPVTVSMPTAREREAEHHRREGLDRRSLPMPTKLQKVSR